MKTGILIPTRGDRPRFLEFAKLQLKRQTRQPDEILIFDAPPQSDRPDITWRYRNGCRMLAERGVDVMLFWEDDDWYSPRYIENMVGAWEQNGRPDIFGLSGTIYYNIFTRKWAQFGHPGRASMMSTMMTARALEGLKWCADDYSFVDIHLWKTIKSRRDIDVAVPWCIGIKHGIGLCGGGGHVNNWPSFKNFDPQFADLARFTDDPSVRFYTELTTEIQTVRMTPKPFLSIITRVMHGKRNGLFGQHQRSVAALESADFEQLFIIDRVGVGMLNANRSFAYAKPIGEFVYLLDDDDFIVDPAFIGHIKRAAEETAADAVFFKMKILTGDGDEIYPKPQSWESRRPLRGQIGGSCFVVRRWVFEKYIHHFGQPSFGDWHFITRVLADPEVRTAWIPTVMAETGRVSRGAAE